MKSPSADPRVGCGYIPFVASSYERVRRVAAEEIWRMIDQKAVPAESDAAPKSGATDGGASPEAVGTKPAPGLSGYAPQTDDPGDTPEAGDVDPGATASADETGQGGDVTEPKKRHGLPWN